MEEESKRSVQEESKRSVQEQSRRPDSGKTILQK
jgi:hypothetical protein